MSTPVIWAAENISNPDRCAAIVFTIIFVYTYAVLRLLEVKNAFYEKTQASLVGADTVENHDIERQESIPFEKVNDAFFHVGNGKSNLGVKNNIAILAKVVATLAFSCHTSHVLPFALSGVLISYGIIILCLWKKQLNYVWMPAFSNNHLQASLFFVTSSISSMVTLLVWYHQSQKGEVDKEILDGYSEVYVFLAGFSIFLGLALCLFWVFHRYVLIPYCT